MYRLRILCAIYKTIDNLNPDFIKKNFDSKEKRGQCKLNLEIPEYNQVTSGSKTLRVFGSKVWNSFLHHIKSTENVRSFKELFSSSLRCCLAFA